MSRQKTKNQIYQFDSDSEYESQHDKQQQMKHRSKQQSITIKDLCPEDKAKIGQLIKKLADEKSEKEKLSKMLDENKNQYEERLRLAVEQQQQSKIDSQVSMSSSQKQISINRSPLQVSNKSTKNEKDEKEKLLRSQIQQIDQEIQGLMQFDQKNNSNISQQMQSPNFKTLTNIEGNSIIQSTQNIKNEHIQNIFKSNFNIEPSPSFLYSRKGENESTISNNNIINDRLFQTDQNQKCTPPIKKLIPRYVTLQNDQFEQTSQTIQSDQNIKILTPIKPSSSCQQNKSSKSKKKEMLMKKIQEFERIIERMNFSKSQDIDSSHYESNRSSVQDMYSKLIHLEEELKRLNKGNGQQKENGFQNMSNCDDSRQTTQKQNEDDLVIELLNNSFTNYFTKDKIILQQTQNQDNIACDQSSIYGQSFLVLVDNIELTERKKNQEIQILSTLPKIQSTTTKPNEFQDYNRNVLNKYDGLIQELKYEFDSVF